MHTFSPASEIIRSNSRKIVSDLLQRYHDACCKYLKLHRPDLIHVLTPGPGAEMLIRAAHDTNIPVIYQEVGIPFHPPGFEEVYERFVSVLPLCTGVAVLSPCLAEELSQVLPNVGTAHVLPLISLDHNGVSSPNSTSEVVTFGFAARLEHLKGPMRLLDAFRIAHETHPQIRLKIAGEGSQRHDFVVTSRRFGLENKCQLAGVYTTLEERSRFMAGIDVFALPSLTEGTPNVIIEAMAHAKPVIATAVGGVPDLVGEEVGILVPSDDSRALGAAMARLAGDVDLRRRMGIAARKKYEQLFTPQAVLPLLVDFYEQVMERYAANNRGVVKSKNRERPLAESNHPWFVANAQADVR